MFLLSVRHLINTLRPRQNGRHFPDDIFKWICLNENVWISINTSLKFVPMGPINNICTLVQVMAWRRPGDKPLSEPMMVRLPTHICVTRPQWVKASFWSNNLWIPVTYPGQQWPTGPRLSYGVALQQICEQRRSILSTYPRWDHFVYAPSQCETTFQCNVVSHWLGACTKWFLSHHRLPLTQRAPFTNPCTD